MFGAERLEREAEVSGQLILRDERVCDSLDYKGWPREKNVGIARGISTASQFWKGLENLFSSF